MTLQIYPMVEGNLGVDTKNVWVARFSEPLANLTPEIIEASGVKEGDTIYLTDSDENTMMYKVGLNFVIDEYVLGGAAGTGNVLATGAFNVGDALIATTLDGKQVISGGPIPVIDPNTVTSASTGTANNVAIYDGVTRSIAPSGIDSNNVVTTVPSSTTGQLTQWASANKDLADSGILSADVVTSASVGVAGEVATYAGANKSLQSSGTQLSSLAPINTPSFTGGVTFENASPAVPTIGNATITGNSVTGLTMLGNGSTSDITIGNSAGSSVMVVPNATVNANFSGEINVGNINVAGNTISSIDVNGDINLTPNGTGRVQGQTTTQSPGDNSDNFASTAYVDTSLTGLLSMYNNIGQVKVNGRGGVKPTLNLVAGVTQQVQYQPTGTLDISASPTTHWPLANTTQLDSSVYDSTENSWLENTFKLGQPNIFRISFSYSGKAPNQTETVRFRMYNTNPASSFERFNIQVLEEGATAGQYDFDLTTISDQLSVPLPLGSVDGHGYNFEVTCSGALTLVLEDVTIISLATSFI